jgi:transcription elongation factor S-II
MIKVNNPEEFRENIRNKLMLFLESKSIENKNENENENEMKNIFINLEKGIFNFAIKEAKQRKIVKKWENPKFVQIYTDRLRSIYLNLKNEHLLNALLISEISPQQLAFMTHQELNPERWKVLIDRKMKRDDSKLNTNVQASTDMFTCRKCKSKKCTYYELQTRSADEPTTIFVTCLDCGKNWKT